MPAPVAVICVVAVIGSVAAGVAFKELVYEPHIAPKFEQWAAEFLAKRESKREARRRRRAGAVPVAQSRRRSHSKHSDSSADNDDDGENKRSYELDSLVSKEVREWRSNVDLNSLRHRKNGSPSGTGAHMDKPNPSIPYKVIDPTHVIFDSSASSTPSSTLRSPVSSPPPQLSSLHLSSSRSTLRSAPSAPNTFPSPDISSRGASPAFFHATMRSPPQVPSLSQSYPQDLDHEHDLELLSAPSSRPDSPFSAFSQPASVSGIAPSNISYQTFSASLMPRPESRPPTDTDALSELSDELIFSPALSASSVARSAMSDHLHSDDEGSEGSNESWASVSAHSRSAR